MEHREAPESGFLHPDELDEETDSEVADHQQVEKPARREVRPVLDLLKVDEHEQHESGLVQLRRVPRDIVAEVHAPGQSCRNAVAAALEEAAQPPDGQPQRYRRGEEVPTPSFSPMAFLVNAAPTAPPISPPTIVRPDISSSGEGAARTSL